jgi:hypothetical protein
MQAASVRKQVGLIGVDAGVCWIGDPRYILHAKPAPKAIGKDWGEFCGNLEEGGEFPGTKQFNFDLGHAGLGVVVSTGWGDGVYPVYATFDDDGRVASVTVEFLAEEDDS